LDINTYKGQITVKQELDCVELFELKNPKIKYISTNKERPVSFDGLLIKDNKILSIVETKCRVVSEDKFRSEYESKWLVTFDKLIKCVEISRLLHVPLVGFLYLVPDRVLLVKKLTNEDGEFVCEFTCKNTVTQATVNGGLANRTNAFIDMSGSTRFSWQ
jgi:hypothetical protein